MTVYNVGRICLKIAGRDAGQKCVILDKKDDKVLIDGQTRRRYVNPEHLEPLSNTLEGVSKDSTASELNTHL